MSVSVAMEIALLASCDKHLQVKGGRLVYENAMPSAILHIIHCHAVSMQATTRKTRILDVVYNASNNELVSTSSAECLAPASFSSMV